jgi:uncharacterized membrane protein YheB (UPF0754 family)
MNWWLLIVIPLMSALIGWASNWLLIKMLFHPKKPVYVLGFTVQGIFPKRQMQFAAPLSTLVSKELLSFTELEAKITSPDNFKKIMPTVEIHVDDFLRNKLKEAFPMIGMLIGDRTINTLKEIFMNELETLFPVIMKSYMQNLQNDLDLEKLISDKLAAFSPDKLETVLYQTMGKELRLAGLIGGVLGFVIGLAQVLLIMALG